MRNPVSVSALALLLPAVLLLTVSSAPLALQAEEDESMMAVKVRKILLIDDHPAVMLTNDEERAHLLVFIDHFMAQAIQMGVMGMSIERPLTHDLIGILINRLGAKVNKVSITELRNNTYYALITLRVNGSLQEIDARPSDALAIAVRTKAPIYVARDLMSDVPPPEGDRVPEHRRPSVLPDQPRHGA